MNFAWRKLLLDGVDNTEMIAQTQIVRSSIDALQEFNVITSNASADFNRGGGVVVVTSTKQGTNQFHGSVYEHIRNAVDAKNYVVRTGAPNPRYQLNDFGGHHQEQFTLGHNFLRIPPQN